ncbi:MAG TPA: PadR family transcriptional regulator [Sumerlaeia bacterium]|nr:PadR family transcriptional regulator [Sumerlaeia bacterium]
MTPQQPSLQNWKTQLRKGVLELCILNRLLRRECYGYDLVQDLKRVDVLQMREGTIYPILARLEEDGLVASHVETSSSGPPRKYVKITRDGEKAVEEMNRHWEQIRTAVHTAKSAKGGKTDEN